MGFFCPNHVHFQLKKYRRIISHDTEEWCKVLINLDLVVSKLAWGIGWTLIKALKNLEIFHDTERWYKIQVKNWLLVSKMTWQMKSDGNFEERLTFCFKNDTRSLMYFNSSSEKSEHLNFDRIYLSKVYRWVVSWKMINGLKNDIYKKFGQFSHKYLKVMLDKSSAYNVLAEEMYFSDQCIPLNFNFLDFPVLVWSYPNPSYDFWNREPVFV